MTGAYRPRYRLDFNVTIREVDERGSTMNNALEVRDTQQLGAMDFLEIAGVLGKFHDLAQTIKKEKDA